MHDSKGRKIEFGDVVVAKQSTFDGKYRAMKVIGGSSQAQSCNVQLLDFDSPAPIYGNANETTVIVTRDGEVVGP